MLLTFSFTNFGPYAEETTFDMRTVASYKEHEYNTQKLTSGEGALKVAAVYGANASGKSQFVKAYECFRNIVLKSFRESSKATTHIEESGPISIERSYLKKNYHPYRFRKDSRDTEFDVMFEMPKAVYNYGFIYNATEIVAEWLYVTSNTTKRQSTIIERSTDAGIKLGASVRKECVKYVPSIPRDVLALSFFNSLALKTSVFNDVTSAIGSILPLTNLMGGREVSGFLRLYFDSLYSDDMKDELIGYLRSMDLGIIDFTVEKGKDDIMVWSHHVGEDGGLYKIPLELESDGTKKLIALHYMIFRATTHEAGLIIDELDAELHPLLLRHIVGRFHAQSARGQLVFTAHDLSLLDKRYFRRDQVWFSAKDGAGHSVLRSLADFKVRNDSSFGDAYLAGVFGAIPDIAKEGEGNGNR